jgi:hypothetical protein
MSEHRVDTPLIRRLRKKQARRKAAYTFSLPLRDLSQLFGAGMTSKAVVVYAIIRGAAFGPRATQSVTIRKHVRDGVNRDYRWWRSATQRLEEAGFIDVERHRGRLPRYRLRPSRGRE